jgi:hypothetical protein
MVLLRNLSEELGFLEGRTERYEGVSVHVEARFDAVILKVGDRERHTIAYHAKDNTWTCSFHSRDPWVDGGIKTLETGPLARQTFLASVLYSLRACKQIGGAPMVTRDEETRLLAR